MQTERGFDRVGSALGTRQRRHVLVELLDRDPVAVQDVPATDDGGEDLAVEVVESEPAPIALTHVHLPKLEATVYVDWNRDSPTIATGANRAAVEAPVSVLTDHEDDLTVTWP